MRMTPIKLIGLRLFLITFGRIPWCARAFKQFMVWLIVIRQGEKKKEKYLPSSRFFTLDQLEKK